MIDAANKCSTGYIYRLINSLSGLTEYNLKITFEEQIASNLHGRLNRAIKNLDDDEFRNNVLWEMSLCSDVINKKKNFMKFFREILPKLKEELWIEFRDYITDVDFDLYLRKSISLYEGIKFL